MERQRGNGREASSNFSEWLGRVKKGPPKEGGKPVGETDMSFIQAG